MIVRIEDCAERDLVSGFWFYENPNPGMGDYFLIKIREEILELAGCGGVHRKRHGFHFCPSKRFPHGFYYQIASETVKVYAVLDCRRSPRWIRRQLQGRQ